MKLHASLKKSEEERSPKEIRLNQVKQNTDLMQHCVGFISAESLYMFRASSAHHQEY
jgi:hypothetical protein